MLITLRKVGIGWRDYDINWICCKNHNLSMLQEAYKHGLYLNIDHLCTLAATNYAI